MMAGLVKLVNGIGCYFWAKPDALNINLDEASGRNPLDRQPLHLAGPHDQVYLKLIPITI
jgi:hypothetical protein